MHKKQAVLRKLFLSLGFFLLATPLMALLSAAVNPASPYPFFLPLTAVVALSLLVRALPKKARPAGIALGAVLVCASLYGAIVLSQGSMWLMLLAIPFIAAFLADLLIMSMQSGEEFLAPVWYVGLLVYLIARLVASAEGMEAALPVVQAVTPIFFVFVVFALNSQATQEGMGDERRPSRLMLLRNRLFSVAISAVMLIFAYQEKLRKLLWQAWEAFKRFLGWLAELLKREEEVVAREVAEKGDMSFLPAADGEPAWWVQMLEQILRVAALAGAAVLTVFIAWQFIKLLIKGVKLLVAYLREYAGRVSESYEDTVESLLDWGEVKRVVERQREKMQKRREMRVPWEKLTPRQRVRRAYLILRQKNADVPGSSTARTSLTRAFAMPQQADTKRLADIYDAARYSEQEISADAADYMRTMAEKRVKRGTNDD